MAETGRVVINLRTGLEPPSGEGGEPLVCPTCLNTKGLEGIELLRNALIAGPTPLSEWVGEEYATVFGY